MTARDNETMIAHARARGAVNTPMGLATLVGWPPASQARCHVVVGRDRPRHLRPFKAETIPVVCDACNSPADWRCVEHGLRLCMNCALDEQAASA